ncbi:MAG: DMT family transporter [Bacteroidales bacterium]|nr:DMT family transporter [Bacteroidales bacterium]
MPARKIGFHLLALAVVAVWGVTFVSTKTLINAGMHPAAIFTIRFILAYIGIWILDLATRRPAEAGAAGRPRLLSNSWKDEAIFLFLGITGGSMYFLTENTALAYTQAANVAFLVCITPLLTAILTLIGKRVLKGRFAEGLENIKVGFPLIGGTILALTGMALVLFDGARPQFSLKGDLLSIGAALCWSSYSIFMGRMTKDYGAVFATRKVFFYGLITILPFLGGVTDSFAPAVLGKPEVWLNLLFLGLLASLACFVAWNLVMSRLGNVTCTNYVYLNPVFTLISASIILGEKLTPMSMVGSAAILIGVILAGRRDSAGV